MPKPSKQQLSTKMQERNPLDMRQQIVPVDALLTERIEGTNVSNDEDESLKKPIEPNVNAEHLTERVERTGTQIGNDEDIHSIKKVNGNAEQTTERKYPSNEPIGKPDRKQRSAKASSKPERSKRKDKPNARADTSKRTILQELRQGVEETETPHTERYSFEIYPNQKDRIKEFQDLYQQKTGRKLSASRILREGLEMYLEKAFQLLNERT